MDTIHATFEENGGKCHFEILFLPMLFCGSNLEIIIQAIIACGWSGLIIISYGVIMNI